MNYSLFIRIFEKFYKEHGMIPLFQTIIKSIFINIRVYTQFLIFKLKPSFSNKKFIIDHENFLFDYKYGLSSNLNFIQKYIKNDFNFLGNNFLDYVDQKNTRSHWIKKNINFSNKRYALNLNENSILEKGFSKNKKLIKWNFDFLSQYYWNNKKYSSFLKLSANQGIDVKIPWEISRLQHLTKLILMGFYEKKNKLKFKIYLHVIHQVFDFIISNPPRFGVNWKSNMEVAIRGSNISVIVDILKDQSILDNDQLNILYNSIYDHMNFVIENLEWSKLSTSNHYLSNIISLIVMANFLPKDNCTSGILSFAYNQLFNEIKNQFYDDGGNKEGSTGYHIFSNEMILIGLNFYKKNPVQDFEAIQNIKSVFNKVGHIIESSEKLDKSLEKQVYKKIKNINFFSSSCRRNDGTLIQIGDNDSGCFFPFNIYNKNEEQKYLQSNIVGISINHPFFCYLNKFNTKCEPHISFNKKLKIKKTNLRKKIDKLSKENKNFFHVPFSQKINLKTIKLKSFPDFGLYQFVNKNISLFIVCKNNYNYFNSGHMHDDNLGIDLVINKTPIITDPGSFCYSRDSELRSLYRSSKSHFVPRTSDMINLKCKEESLFYTSNFLKATCELIDNKSFLGKITFKNTMVYRWLCIKEIGLDIIDFSNTDPLHDYEILGSTHRISSNYGRLIDEKIVKKELLKL